MNNRAIVITEWTSLKEQINTLKLSENDKKAYNFLRKSKLGGDFFTFEQSISTSADLDQLAQAINEECSWLLAAEINNDLLAYWQNSAMFGYASAITEWIKLKKLNTNLYEELAQLQAINQPTIEEVD